MIKRMMMALCIFVCTFTLVACSGQQTNEPLTLGVNAIITEIDKENKIITTKDSEEKGVLGNDCLIDCSKIPMIYCNYDTQDVVAITLDDLQVGDEIDVYKRQEWKELQWNWWKTTYKSSTELQP